MASRPLYIKEAKTQLSDTVMEPVNGTVMADYYANLSTGLLRIHLFSKLMNMCRHHFLDTLMLSSASSVVAQFLFPPAKARGLTCVT